MIYNFEDYKNKKTDKFEEETVEDLMDDEELAEVDKIFFDGLKESLNKAVEEDKDSDILKLKIDYKCHLIGKEVEESIDNIYRYFDLSYDKDSGVKLYSKIFTYSPIELMISIAAIKSEILFIFGEKDLEIEINHSNKKSAFEISVKFKDIVIIAEAIEYEVV